MLMKLNKLFTIFSFVICLLIGWQIFFDDLANSSSYNKYLTSSSVIADRVEVRLYNVDDFASLYVNGVKFTSTKYSMDTGRIKLDKYLVNGQNILRFITYNNGGRKPDNPMSYGYQVWLNNKIVLDDMCGQIGIGGCVNNRNFPGGKVYDKTLKINVNSLNSKNYFVNINSAIQGRIYLNDEYTGKVTPSTLVLPTGDYRIGLGSSNNRYQELKTQITKSQTLMFENKHWFPAKRWKILLIAIRTAHLGNGKGENQIAELSNSDIKAAYNDLIEVNNRWIKPFSYGLVDWDVSELIVENVRASITDRGDHINQNLFLQEAGLTSLQDKYDTLVYFWPRIANGKDPWNNPGAIGGGLSVSVPNTWVRWVKKFPREIWLHEWLHVVEGVNSDHGFFNGQNGLHGAEDHGYVGGTEGEWLNWYRDFMRGMVKEDDLFIGVRPHSWGLGNRLGN
jgi:hypothetical protein